MRAWTSWPQRWPRLNHVRDWHNLVWQTDLLRAEKRGVSVPNLRVLVVAPTSDLPDTAAEIAAIHRCHETTILAGSVRDVDIAQAVIEQSYDVLWLIGHGDEQGVECAGTRLSISSLVQYIRAGEVSLCVLNTCSSENIARQIAMGSDADVICTISDVENPDAIRLGMLLAEELAAEQSYYDAYEIVAPPGGPYRYYQAKDSDIIPTRRNGQLSEEIFGIKSDVRVMRVGMLGIVVAILVLAVVIIALWLHVDSNFQAIFQILSKM